MTKLSIVIPTRNRPDHLRYAVDSLSDQNSPTLEIVISDNSDKKICERNKRFIETKADKRIVYRSPASIMSMVDHWNWAVAQATGEYVGILTDRMVFKKGAIEYLNNVLTQYSPNVLGYQHDRLVGEGSKPTYVTKEATEAVRVIKCSSVITEAARGQTGRHWPRMLNCVSHRCILSELESEYGKVFSGIAPDYSFCFRLTDWTDEYHFLEKSLIISGGLDVSNGRAYARQDQRLINDYVRLTALGISRVEQEIFDKWLFPLESSVPGNAEMFEYIRAMKEQRSGKFVEMDLQGFYDTARKSLKKRRREGLDTSVPRRELEDFRRKHRLRRAAFKVSAKEVMRNTKKAILGGRNVRKYDGIPVKDIWDARQQS